MTDDFKTCKDRAIYLKALYGDRDKQCNNMDAMYYLRDPDESKLTSKSTNTKLTLSPDPRNRAQGVVRLLTATEPNFSVPREKNSTQNDISNQLEKWADTCWRAATRFSTTRPEKEIVRSLTLYDESYLAVTRTADMLLALDKRKDVSAAERRRVEEIASCAPYLFEPWHVKSGFPEVGRYGLDFFYRCVEMTVSEVRSRYPGIDQLSDDKYSEANRYNTVTLHETFGLDSRYAWLDDTDTPILEEENKLPFIPVVVGLGDGSRIATTVADQREPFLRTLWDSKTWQRQNLIATAMSTMAFAVGVNPVFVYEGQQGEIEVDFSKPGGTINIRPGEKLYQLLERAIDPSLQELLALTNSKVDESTIYSQTLGAPLGGNPSFSLVSLLSQAGRLPLVSIQRAANDIISRAIKTALLWEREQPGSQSPRYGDAVAELKRTDIPKYFEIECNLDASLPQDKLGQAQIAQMLRGFLSDARIMEDFMGIGQPNDEIKRRWGEQMAEVIRNQYIQQMIAAQQQVPAEVGAMPQQQGPMEMPPDQMTQPMPPTQPQPFAPGMSPEQMQGMMEQQGGEGMMMP